MKHFLTTAVVVAQLLASFNLAYAGPPEAQAVASKVERVMSGLVGRIGVAAQEIDGKEVLTINGDEPFVMASTFKVAIAVTVLDRVDKGELTLEQLADITPDMMVAGDNVIAQNFVHPGIKLSVANLIEAMITESDNTATDICIRLAGGPAAVTKKLRSIGITGQRVDRQVAEILRDFYGLSGLATARVGAEAARGPEWASRASERNLKYESDPRDQSTPNAMLDLLLKIDDGRALSAKSHEFLLGSMSRTRTGQGRLKGLLPKGTPVAHKTGTIGGVANDVGYITLPDGRRFAIAVFTKSSVTREADRDRAIAEVARTLYDYFYMLPATKRWMGSRSVSMGHGMMSKNALQGSRNSGATLAVAAPWARAFDANGISVPDMQGFDETGAGQMVKGKWERFADLAPPSGWRSGQELRRDHEGREGLQEHRQMTIEQKGKQNETD